MISNDTRILIVDDTPDMRESVRSILNEAGFLNIAEAADGVEGYNILVESFDNKKPIQFVFTDWYMPNMTGLEFVMKIRQTTALKDLPCIMITSENDVPMIVKAITAGATNYIFKPVERETLLSKMNEAWKHHHPEK